MPLVVNLRHLEEHGLHLQGELAVAELDLDPHDEVLQLGPPLRYDLEVEKLEEGLLLQGSLRLSLHCQCVRCLKPFEDELTLDPWTAHLPFEGEDAVQLVNDCADLTPYMREDILLAFPRHPLCSLECRGLPASPAGKVKNTSSASPSKAGSPVWAELNKLKLK